MFYYVYFDGSIESFGNLFWSINNKPKTSWIVMDRNINRGLMNIISELEDEYGSLIYKKDGNIKYRTSFGSPRFCCQINNPIEYYFIYLSEQSEEYVNSILNCTTVCNVGNQESCTKCKRCIYCNSLAEEYGLYDILDITNTKYKAF